MKASEEQVAAVASLDEPTRRRLYRYVVETRQPVGRDEAANALGIPRMTAAFHLDRLAAEGLLEVSHRRLTGRSGPGAGRPAKLYRRADVDLSVSLPPRSYGLAGAVLAEAIEEAERSGVSAREAVAIRARDYGAALAGSAATDDAVDILEAAGFEPYADGPGVIRLANCPFHRLATNHVELVCGMNLHLLRGLLDALPTGLSAELDPGPNRCCVRLTRENGQ